MQVPPVARPDSNPAALAGGDGPPASSGTAVVSSQGAARGDRIRQGFEVWLGKATPTENTTGLWYAFQAGALFAEVAEFRGYEHALAILSGEKPPALIPRTWQSDLLEDR